MVEIHDDNLEMLVRSYTGVETLEASTILKLLSSIRRLQVQRTLPLSIQWSPEARDWYCPDLGLHGSQLPPATRALLPPPPAE